MNFGINVFDFGAKGDGTADALSRCDSVTPRLRYPVRGRLHLQELSQKSKCCYPD